MNPQFLQVFEARGRTGGGTFGSPVKNGERMWSRWWVGGSKIGDQTNLRFEAVQYISSVIPNGSFRYCKVTQSVIPGLTIILTKDWHKPSFDCWLIVEQLWVNCIVGIYFGLPGTKSSGLSSVKANITSKGSRHAGELWTIQGRILLDFWAKKRHPAPTACSKKSRKRQLIGTVGTAKLIGPWNAALLRGARFAVKGFKLVGVPREKREPMEHAQGPLWFSWKLELNDLPALNEATNPFLLRCALWHHMAWHTIDSKW